MITRNRTFAVSCAQGFLLASLMVAAPLSSLAQTGLAPAMPSADQAASASAAAPAPLRATPRPTSPTDARRSLDLNNPQPEGKVTPQLRIPLGKKGDTPIFQRQRPNGSAVAPASDPINEAAARCEAQPGEQVRAKCRDQLARETPR